jgi:sec-independent protein translocase protein TatA
VIGDIFQPTHLLVILLVALLVLGPKRLPEVGRSLGKGIRDFRHAMSFDDNEREALNVRQSITDATAPMSAPVAPPTPPPPAGSAPPTEPTPQS